MSKVTKIVIAMSALALAAGCQAPRLAHNIVVPIVPSYHGEAWAPPLHRVAVLPMDFESEVPVIPETLDAVFHEELSKTAAFEVVPVSREELSSRYGIGRLSSVEVIPRDLIPRLVAEYGVDGVLFTDVTHYAPYQPVAIGVRCKLVDVQTGEERWVFDHTFDSGNPVIATAAKRFAIDEELEQVPIGSDGSSILLSPTAFGKYAAHETYRSLLGM